MADIQTQLDVQFSLTYSDPIRPEMGGNLVEVEVVDADNIDPDIFVLHKDVKGQYSSNQEDFFYSVATVHQLKALPKGSGTVDEPFFRVSAIEQSFQTIEEANSFMDRLKTQIHRLVLANNFYINKKNADGKSFRFNGVTITEI